MSRRLEVPKRQVSSRVSAPVADYLVRVAEEEQRSVAWVVDRILSDWVEKEKRDANTVA